MTYAQPHWAVQTRIELIRVHLALDDLAGAWTLMVEIDEILKRRPDLGTLIGEADALRARLAKERSAAIPGASALTAAELRLLPLLSTHLSAPEIAEELFLSLHTIKSQMRSIYRKLGVSSRNQAITGARELGLLEGLRRVFYSYRWDETRAGSRWTGVGRYGRRMNQAPRYQETLRRLAIFDEDLVTAGFGLDLARTSVLDLKTAALLQPGVSVAIGSSAVCLEWSAARALAAGATKDEIADVLLAIAPVAWLGRVVSAAPQVATALEYDIEAALGEAEDH
jgi:DNA-binding CsgD family transcriptional regulator